VERKGEMFLGGLYLIYIAAAGSDDTYFFQVKQLDLYFNQRV
jgi:hypothetical protein